MSNIIRNYYNILAFQDVGRAVPAGGGSGRAIPGSPSRDEGSYTAGQLIAVLRQGFAAAVETYFMWSERARQRHSLGQLDDRLLSDIGVNHAEASAEANKPFWQD